MDKQYMQTRINAVLSDYDGTLSPINTFRSNVESIPEQLEGVLWEISQSIPIGIISVRITIFYIQGQDLPEYSHVFCVLKQLAIEFIEASRKIED